MSAKHFRRPRRIVGCLVDSEVVLLTTAACQTSIIGVTADRRVMSFVRPILRALWRLVLVADKLSLSIMITPFG